MRRLGWMGLAGLLALLARPALAMTLEDAARMALEHAPAHAAARAARDASREDEALARAWLLPYVRGTGEIMHFEQKYYYDRNPGFLQHDVIYNRLQVGVELIQPLFRLDRWAGYAKGKLAARVGELKLTMEKQALLLAVASAYADVLVARERLAAIRAHEKAVRRLRAQARARFDAGTATVNDALEAESRLDGARAIRIQAGNALALARERLASLTGADGADAEPFAGEANAAEAADAGDVERFGRGHGAKDGAGGPGVWRTRGMNEALAVRLARLRLEVARAEVRRSLGQALPAVDLVAGLSRDRETNNLFGTGFTVKTEELGVRMEVPIYAGGGTWAQLRKARKLQVEAEYGLKEAERKAGLAAVRAWRNLMAARARVAASRRALASAVKAREAARVGYEVGLRTMVEMLDAEERATRARGDLAGARADLMLAMLQLHASVGKLDMDAMRSVSRALFAGQ